MNLRQLRQSIGHLKTRIFGLAPTGEPYGRQEMEQLAAWVLEMWRCGCEKRSSRRRGCCGIKAVLKKLAHRNVGGAALPRANAGAGGADRAVREVL